MIILAAVLLFFGMVGWLDRWMEWEEEARISSRLFSGSAEGNYDDRLCGGAIAKYRLLIF